MNYILDRIKSIGHALDGLKAVWKSEINFKTHVFISISVVFLSIFFEITTTEWLIVITCIGVVMAMEIMNTSIELMANFISPQKDEAIKKIKDIAAAGVLTTAIMASIIGLIIFIPKLLKLIIY